MVRRVRTLCGRLTGDGPQGANAVPTASTGDLQATEGVTLFRERVGQGRGDRAVSRRECEYTASDVKKCGVGGGKINICRPTDGYVSGNALRQAVNRYVRQMFILKLFFKFYVAKVVIFYLTTHKTQNYFLSAINYTSEKYF